MQAWENITDVFYLDTMHRIDPTDVSRGGGLDLYHASRAFMNPAVTLQDISYVCDTLHAQSLERRGTSLQALLPKHPQIVVQRQLQRMHLNRSLSTAFAAHTGQVLYVWRCEDSCPHKGEVFPAVHGNMAFDHPLARQSEALPGSATMNMSTFQYFYHGIRYIFTDSAATTLGRVTNNGCTGEVIILDARDAADNADATGKAIRILRFPPTCIFVRPDGVDVGKLCGAAFAGLIPVEAMASSFKAPYKPSPHEPKMKVTIKRYGLPLGEGTVVTDYYAQGLSFKKDLWLADLRPPQQGIKRASILVLLTRWSNLRDVHLLHPLWSTPAGRHDIINTFWRAANGTDAHGNTVAAFRALIVDVSRLTKVAADTKVKYAAQFTHAAQLVPRQSPPLVAEPLHVFHQRNPVPAATL